MLHLVPMTEAEERAYSALMVEEYAAQWVRHGRLRPDRAREVAEREYRELLPSGVHTPGHHLYTLRAGGEDAPAGMLWFTVVGEPGTRTAILYDVRIDPGFRRRGYAMRAVRTVEERARALGASRVSLHVFGHNVAARALYEKLGYEPASITMTRTLKEAAPHG